MWTNREMLIDEIHNVMGRAISDEEGNATVFVAERILDAVLALQAEQRGEKEAVIAKLQKEGDDYHNNTAA